MAPRPRRELAAGRSTRATIRHAAGLLLLFPIDDRAASCPDRSRQTLDRHGGQVSLPGGVIEPGETYEQAALREAHEEIGLAAGRAAALGALTPIDIPVSGFRLHPVVASADQQARSAARRRRSRADSRAAARSTCWIRAHRVAHGDPRDGDHSSFLPFSSRRRRDLGRDGHGARRIPRDARLAGPASRSDPEIVADRARVIATNRFVGFLRLTALSIHCGVAQSLRNNAHFVRRAMIRARPSAAASNGPARALFR